MSLTGDEPPPSSRPRTAAAGRSLRRLLGALARRGAVVRLEDELAVVERGSATAGDVLHRAARTEWDEAIALGLIGGGGDGAWRLTADGRALLAQAAVPRAQPGATPEGAAPAVPSRPVVNLAESPLAWLAARKDRSGTPLLSREQVEAGERLRADFERAALQPRVTVNWEAVGSGQNRGARHGGCASSFGDRAIAARQSVNRALQAVGPELASTLLDVCCHLKGLEQIEREFGWPQRSGKIVLQLALTALARHYGIVARSEGAGRPARVLHWGSADYRPSIGDRDQG